MKNKFVTLSVLCVFLIFPWKVKASNIIQNQTVNPNKKWIIRFSEEIKFDDLTQNDIKVKDENDNEIKIKVVLGKDSESIIVMPPEDGYTFGENYILTIGNNVRAKREKKMKKEVNFKFNIENNIIRVPSELLVKDTNKPLIGTGCGNASNNELWIKYFDGKEELLVSSKEERDMKDLIAEIIAPQFTPDKEKVYFLSAAWATSGAVHVVDIKTKKEHYVCPGNYLKVIQKGDYSGKLIVNQHRYYGYPRCGSYDNYYIMDVDGKEIMNLGDNPEVLKYY